MLILDLKMPHLLHLWENKYFTQKAGSVSFKCLLNPKFMKKLRKM